MLFENIHTSKSIVCSVRSWSTNSQEGQKCLELLFILSYLCCEIKYERRPQIAEYRLK